MRVLPRFFYPHRACRLRARSLSVGIAALALATAGCATTNQPGGDDGSRDANAGPERTGPVRIGLIASEGVGEAAEAMGISTLVTGDSVAQAGVLLEHLNADGGLAGRPVELVVADPLEFGTTDMTAAMDGACRQLTQDDDVDLVVTYFGFTPGVMECFADAGVGVVNDLSTLPEDVMAQYADHLAAPGDLAADRMVVALVDNLVERGWLDEDSTIGVLSHDTQESTDVVDGALSTALEEHGLAIAEHQQVAATAEGAAQSGAAVLKFATAGVDRVIPVGASPLFVMQAASAQGYRPQYAVSSNFGPGALLETTAPQDQLQGAAGIGWLPALDIGGGAPVEDTSENGTLCVDLMAEAGLGATAPTAEAFQLALCNAFFYLDAAAEAAGSVPSDLLGVSRERVGSSFLPASTFASDVTDRVDGVSAYRELAFSDACRCFEYGELHRID